MRLQIQRVSAMAGAIAAVLITFSSAAQADPPSAPCSTRYKLAWQMPLRSSDVGQSLSNVLRRSEFSLERAVTLNRTTIGRAPDGTVALQMNIPKGENVNNSFYLDPLGSKGADAACLSLRVFLPNGFEWPGEGGGTKMGWGLWGGSDSRDLGGGTPASQQTGWSVRNVNNIWGFGLYSYNLNRPGDHGQYGPRVDRWESSNWNSGRWHTIEMEVRLNTVGSSDGYAQVWLNGKSRRTMTNLKFRNDSRWAIRGLMFNDMWGGDTKDKKNWSPKYQNMWYADYKIYSSSGSGSSPASSSPFSSSNDSSSNGSSSNDSSSNDSSSNDSSSGGSGGGSFGAVAPAGPIGGGNVVLRWNRDPSASRYYVRVLTRRDNWSDRKDIYGGTVSPGSCNGSTCSLSIGNLRNDQYEWMVKPYYGSKQGSYSTLAFDVGGSGSSPAPSSPFSSSNDSSSNGSSSSSRSSNDSSSGGSGGGSFGAVAPAGPIGGGNVVLRWNRDPSASRYYVRVLTRRDNWSDRKDIYGGTVSPGSCNGSTCSLSIGNLRNDQYEWMVKPYYGSKQGSYSTLAFDVR